jgi:hypothetical protein
MLLTALRGGGHVILLRHAATHADQADTDLLQLDDVGRQLNRHSPGTNARERMANQPRAGWPFRP